MIYCYRLNYTAVYCAPPKLAFVLSFKPAITDFVGLSGAKETQRCVVNWRL